MPRLKGGVVNLNGSAKYNMTLLNTMLVVGWSLHETWKIIKSCMMHLGYGPLRYLAVDAVCSLAVHWVLFTVAADPDTQVLVGDLASLGVGATIGCIVAMTRVRRPDTLTYTLFDCACMCVLMSSAIKRIAAGHEAMADAVGDPDRLGGTFSRWIQVGMPPEARAALAEINCGVAMTLITIGMMLGPMTVAATHVLHHIQDRMGRAARERNDPPIDLVIVCAALTYVAGITTASAVLSAVSPSD